ncbi:MAG: TetR/AcrR family transcriptional regulator, partial [Alphaproteobacteria bacterium]|nr:TetR/AcrR family transcriptional regulator [Alphaproteobacteria bacterium]
MSEAAAAARQERRAQLKDRRRELVLEAAQRVFGRVGLEGATMRAIAAEAGYAVGALYQHFASREQIYGELLARSLAQLGRRVRAAITAGAPADARVRAAARAFFEYYRERPDELSLGLYLSRGAAPRGLGPELDRLLNGRLIGVLALIAEPLRELMGGAMAPAHRATARLTALIVGALILETT